MQQAVQGPGKGWWGKGAKRREKEPTRKMREWRFYISTLERRGTAGSMEQRGAARSASEQRCGCCRQRPASTCLALAQQGTRRARRAGLVRVRVRYTRSPCECVAQLLLMEVPTSGSPRMACSTLPCLVRLNTTTERGTKRGRRAGVSGGAVGIAPGDQRAVHSGLSRQQCWQQCEPAKPAAQPSRQSRHGPVKPAVHKQAVGLTRDVVLLAQRDCRLIHYVQPILQHLKASASAACGCCQALQCGRGAG